MAAMKLAFLIQRSTEAREAVAESEEAANGTSAMVERIRDTEARERLRLLRGLTARQSRDEEPAAEVASAALLAAGAIGAAGRVDGAGACERGRRAALWFLRHFWYPVIVNSGKVPARGLSVSALESHRAKSRVVVGDA